MANVIIILGIIFLIIGCVYAIYCFINEMGLYMTIFFSVFCLVIGGILIKDGIDRKNAKEQEQMRNEIVDIDERTVVLKELPEQSSYYEVQNLSGGTKIKYLDGKELVTLNIDNYREFYDAKNQPYIEIKESKNTYGDVLETNVVIHLKELEDD